MASGTNNTDVIRVRTDREQITKDNQLNSPLLRLPAELRNKIYHFVFRDTTVRLRLRYEIGPSARCVLQVCGQTRQEALSIFYDYAIFDLTHYYTLSDIVCGPDDSDRASIQTIILSGWMAASFKFPKALSFSSSHGLHSLRCVHISADDVGTPLRTLRQNITTNMRAWFGKKDLEEGSEVKC
ncbi:hypothetical protein P153DRAFT_398514 [Dothidotthia symphoricarpi CBS 119687]|uniref:Uncharacterized protein n=1 Tax=Dothidotthia symphoricarpi CBS 119687 TaxID=1392245 RepID=A0A6A6A8L3_9PLEO|nr:uncharacterized protein P153DRAFT_398514 [Dothidotthia symphoricarpi CBS 119687]KAF2127148.1 hypothetical protein P153DRAFT_398514 [Dothidotthia symphoricarpi CBS 119687]